MSEPIRLTVVMTHPIQYYAPWFRHIAARCRELDLTVVYATEPTPAQQGDGFGVGFEWDIPLLEGYRCRVVRPARPSASVHSGHFLGVDVPEIGTAVRESGPDVVLIPGWHSITLVRALWACRRARIPVLYRGDTHLGSAPLGWRRIPWAAKSRLLLRGFDGYLNVGRRASAYVERFGRRGAPIVSAPHCVDNSFFAERAAPHLTPAGRAIARASLGVDQGDFAVLFAGKLEPKKRPLDLIRAMARLRPGARLLVVGAGAMEAECRDEAKRLGVEAAWAGFLNQSELGRAYAAADCLALPSDWGETWGLVVNEALATGLPCVVSDRVGCAPDLIAAGETGEVFAMGDVDALAAALERIRPAGRDRGPACRQRAAEYSFERATSGLVAACRAVARRRASVAAGGALRHSVLACCGDMVVVGGLERMTFEVLRTLRARGVPVHCIVNSWENERIVALAREIGASWSIGYYRTRFDRHAPGRLPRYAWDVALTSLGLLRDARRFRPTHILLPSHVSVLRNAPALAFARLFGRRVVFQVANAPEPGAFYRRLWRRGVAPFVDHFVANSEFTRRALVDHGIAPSKVSTIYNCAPRRAWSGADMGPRIDDRVLYVGQIIPAKGLDVLLDAIALLAAAGSDVRLDVVGDIASWEPPAWRGYHARVLARAAERDLAGRVRFLGWREDVPDLLERAALHCCPSLPEIREAFGLVNVEAKAAGTPSVVFPSGGLPELFEHGVDGWVCRAATARALADGIAYFLADPARLRAASAAARRSAERFGRDRFAAEWWALVSGRSRVVPGVPARE